MNNKKHQQKLAQRKLQKKHGKNADFFYHKYPRVEHIQQSQELKAEIAKKLGIEPADGNLEAEA
jgi:hypothetical protein